MRRLGVLRAGPGLTVQDMGRPGYLAFGLSRGGAMDRLALAEAAALLGQPPGLALIEMAGMGGEFEAGADLRIALTGAPMAAEIDGQRVAWNACHVLPAGARLNIGAARAGVYGYLALGGGIATDPVLGSRSAHLAAGLGAPLAEGDLLPVGDDPAPGRTGLALPEDDRFSGGPVRVVAGPQTGFFDDEVLRRFTSEPFRRDTRGNRMGLRLLPEGPGLAAEAGLSILSEIVVPGDIQITGDGTPFVLMAECQTTGGYPRIGTVIGADLPRVAQSAPGAKLRFQVIGLDEARAIEATERARIEALADRAYPLVRDPATIPDLLSYQLISGVTAGDDT